MNAEKNSLKNMWKTVVKDVYEMVITSGEILFT